VLECQVDAAIVVRDVSVQGAALRAAAHHNQPTFRKIWWVLVVLPLPVIDNWLQTVGSEIALPNESAVDGLQDSLCRTF
jgi:hypothetical protein